MWYQDLTDLQTYNSLVVIISIISILVSIIGFGFLWIGIRQNTKQQQAQTFLEYTKRYREICGNNFSLISSFPHLKKPSANQKKIYKNYLPELSSLVQQEYFLYKEGLISEEIWMLWKSYLVYDIKTSEFQKFWEIERQQNSGDRDFVEMIDKMVGTI